MLAVFSVHTGLVTTVSNVPSMDRAQPAHPYLTGPFPRAFAHRGWHIDDLADMENSLPAFRRAVDEGYRYLETDVHVTSDGVVVVHHDALLDRTTDRTGPIATQRWDQVRRAMVGGRSEVPRLADLLEEFPDTYFNVDVKAAGAVEPFVAVVRRAGAFDRVAGASFSDARLTRLRKLAGPDLITSMGPRSVALLKAKGRLSFLPLGRFSRGAMAQVPPRHGRLTIVDSAFIRSARASDVEVHTWTINEKSEMAALLDLGVHGIVTDRPDVLKALLAERSQWPEKS